MSVFGDEGAVRGDDVTAARRSTFRPRETPTEGAGAAAFASSGAFPLGAVDPADAVLHDDDELAEALAAAAWRGNPAPTVVPAETGAAEPEFADSEPDEGEPEPVVYESAVLIDEPAVESEAEAEPEFIPEGFLPSELPADVGSLFAAELDAAEPLDGDTSTAPDAAESFTADPFVAESFVSERPAEEEPLYFLPSVVEGEPGLGLLEPEAPELGGPNRDAPEPEFFEHDTEPSTAEPESADPAESAPQDLGALLFAAPPPRPESVVVPPAGFVLPAPPQRRSLDDHELALKLQEEVSHPGGVAVAIEEMEAQLRLREEENRGFANWEQSMRAIGTPEALETVEQARETFTGVIPLPHLAAAARPEQPIVWEMPAAAAPVEAPESLPPAPQAQDAAPGIPDLIEPEPHTWEPGRIEEALAAGALGAVAATPLAAPDHVDAGENAPAAAATTVSAADIGDDLEGIDDTDLVGFATAAPGVAAGAPAALVGASPSDEAPPAEASNVSIDSGAPTVASGMPGLPPQRVFGIEDSGLMPTPRDYRVGRSVRLFWLWFAANSSVVTLGLGAVLFSLGMSARQSLVAVLAGVAFSFIPLGLSTLAGKWSGQPTMIVSRAAFGHRGNIVPASLAVITRVFWGAAMLWILAIGTTEVLHTSGVVGDFGRFRLTVATLGAGFLLALIIAFFGYRLITALYLVVSVVGGVLVIGLIIFTWPAIDFEQVRTVVDGPWMLVVSGAVLVFSFVGLAWANSGAELARYQRPGGSGAASMMWATFGTTLPTFVLISYGSLLAASSPDLAVGLRENPLGAIASLLPSWYPIPLVLALGLGMLCGIVLTVYSGAFALQAIGARVRRPAGVLIIALAVAALALAFAYLLPDVGLLVRDLATTVAVPVAAWVGIFATDLMIRTKRFDSLALVRRGGLYPDVNWVNLGMLLLATGLGFGLTTATIAGLDWQGYLFAPLGLPATGVLAESDLGVLVALVLGLLTPLVSGIPGIRRQERAQTHQG